MTLSAVLFDMDGLLVNTEPIWLEVEHQTLAALGGTWSEADQRAIMGASMAHATAYIRTLSGTDRTDHEVGELLIGTMLERLDGAQIPIQPGAADLLADVASSGVPFALVSASVRPIVDLVLAFMNRSGLPVFPVSVAGDEVARSKPDPLPYLHAADLLGVDITRAVVLEDSLERGAGRLVGRCDGGRGAARGARRGRRADRGAGVARGAGHGRTGLAPALSPRPPSASAADECCGRRGADVVLRP